MSADADNLQLIEHQLQKDARVLWVLGLLCLGFGLLFAGNGTDSVQGRDDAIIYGVVVGVLVLGGALLLWRGLRSPHRHPLMQALTSGERAIEKVSISYRPVHGGEYEARVEVRVGTAWVAIEAPLGCEKQLADWLHQKRRALAPQG